MGESETQIQKRGKKLGKKERVRWLKLRCGERTASTKHSTRVMFMLTTLLQLFIGH